MTRSRIYGVLAPLLMCGVVFCAVIIVQAMAENPTWRQLAFLFPTFVLVASLLSAVWFFSRCALGPVFPKAEPAKPCWTALHVLLAFLSFALLPYALSGLAHEWFPGYGFAVGGLARILIFFIVMEMIRRCGGDPVEVLGLRLRSNDGRSVTGVIAFMAFLPCVDALSAVSTTLLNKLLQNGVDLRQSMVKAFQTSPLHARVEIAIVVVLVAPIIEEVLFRGLLSGLLRRHVRPLLAMVAVGMLFGVVHDSPASFLPISLLGFVLCYLYEKTGRLSVPIIAHLIFNGITVVMMTVSRG